MSAPIMILLHKAVEMSEKPRSQGETKTQRPKINWNQLRYFIKSCPVTLKRPRSPHIFISNPCFTIEWVFFWITLFSGRPREKWCLFRVRGLNFPRPFFNYTRFIINKKLTYPQHRQNRSFSKQKSRPPTSVGERNFLSVMERSSWTSKRLAFFAEAVAAQKLV